jgi:hypothetical protein
MSPRRAARLARICAPVCLAAFAAAAAPAHALLPRGVTHVSLEQCRSALAQSDRYAVFEGDMRAIRGAARLQMRFTLQARTEDLRDWTRVAAPGFGVWTSAAPGVQRYVYTKRVENLVSPADYRTLVSFRWLDADGDVLARAVRRTAACHQSDLRPDLRPTAVTLRPGSSADRRTYLVAVRNAGRTAAGAFAVSLTVDGGSLPVKRTGGLPAGERMLFAFEGPRCSPGTQIVARVDADATVDERDERDNELLIACPAG